MGVLACEWVIWNAYKVWSQLRLKITKLNIGVG